MTIHQALNKAANYGLYFEVMYMIEMGYDPDDVLEIFDLE